MQRYSGAFGTEVIRCTGLAVGAVLLPAAVWSAAYAVLLLAHMLGAFPSVFAQFPSVFSTGATVFAGSVLLTTFLIAGLWLARGRH